MHLDSSLESRITLNLVGDLDPRQLALLIPCARIGGDCMNSGEDRRSYPTD